jgi:hypothetical protein
VHQLAGILKPGQVPEFGHKGHGDGELDTPQRLQRLDHRRQASGIHVVLPFSPQTLQAFGLFMNRAHVCLENNRLHRCGTDHFGEPPEMGRAPSGPAGRADIVAEQKGCEPELGGLEIADGIFTRAGEVAHGFVLDRGNIDGRAIPRAHRARKLDRVTPVSVHAVSRLFGNEGGRDDVADMALFGQIAIEPGPAWSRFIDKDEVLGFGVQLAHERVNVGLPGADGPKVDDLGVVCFGNIGHRDGLFVDVQSDVKRARLAHG